jgi:4-amino-4-deoxy-L-arabinose transferase-like glycosyltransferase
MIVLAVLPMIAFFLVWIFFASLPNQKEASDFHWQESLIKTGLFWSALLVLGTELLSLFTALTTLWVALFWGLVSITLVLFLWKTDRITSGWHKLWDSINVKLGWFGLISLAVIVVFMVVILVTGLMSPPSIHDVLTYHMARVMHWVQDRSLAFYPTSITWQLWMPPFAEMSQLNWQLLAGGDLLSFFPQWYSLILTMVAVSASAGLLGAKRRGKWLAAIFVMTLPVVVLQASGAKNDLVLAFFFASLVYFMTKAVRVSLTIWDKIGMGIAVALGLLTKGNFPFFILPLLIWLLIVLLRKIGWKKTLLFACIGVLVVAGLDAGHWVRNTLTFGGPFNSAGANFTLNQRFGLDVLISNFSRNIVSQMISTSFINNTLINGLQKLHTWLGIPLFDQMITHGPTEFYDVPTREEVASNPFQFLTTCFVLLVLLIGLLRKKGRSKLWNPLLLAVVSISGMLLFSAAFRWQVWGSRYFIPYYVLFAPVVGYTFSKRLPNWMTWGLVLVLLVWSINPLLNNYSRSFSWSTENRNSIWRMSRKGLLFANHQAYEGAILELTHAMDISGCRTYGLVTSGSAPEYLIWATLSPDMTDYDLEGMAVDNPSADLTDPDFNPCGVIVYETDVPGFLAEENYQFADHWEYIPGEGYPLSLYLLPQYLTNLEN